MIASVVAGPVNFPVLAKCDVTDVIKRLVGERRSTDECVTWDDGKLRGSLICHAR